MSNLSNLPPRLALHTEDGEADLAPQPHNTLPKDIEDLAALVGLELALNLHRTTIGSTPEEEE